VAHTPGNFSSFGSSASIYNFEKWTSEEKNQATISHVAASMTGTEDDKMRYMMGNWIQQVRNNADGFENGRMPTTMEMKRFCVNLTTQAATSQQNQTQSTCHKQTKKRAKRVHKAQEWHSNPSRKGEKPDRYLVWPLTEAMINSEAKSSRRLRAYAKVLPLYIHNGDRSTTIVGRNNF